MKELLRTNDPVLISFIKALLTDAGIEAAVLDSHTSILEGSLNVLPQRILVSTDDINQARRLLDEASIGYDPKA